MKFKIKLTSKYKITPVSELTENDNLEFKICRAENLPGWESIIIKNPEEHSNKYFPWIFVKPTEKDYDLYAATDSAFKLLYLTSSEANFYLVEPPE